MTPPPYLTAPGPNRRQHPAAVLRALVLVLGAAGLTALYGSACTVYGVLSVTYGLTVWTNGRLLWWRTPDGNETTWPAADPEGAGRMLVPSPATHRRPQTAPNALT